MNVKKISVTALFVSLSVVGAYLKIPAPIASVALDIFPALIAGVLVDRKVGAAVGGLGHILSAFFGGMPLGIFHLLVGLEMAFIVWLFATMYRARPALASVLFVFLNGVVASIPFIFIISFEFYLAIIPSLIIASAVNVLLALLALPRLEKILMERELNIKW